jgi:hypothetical protein
MGRLAGEFDPVTFLSLSKRVDDMLATRFAEDVPDSCPSDPIAKQDHLRALALAALVEGEGGGVGRPEYIVVLDAREPDSHGLPVVDVGIPVEVPFRVLAELAADADIHTVVARGGIIVHAPGQLNLGRTSRLPNRAQRRALRALYPTCGVHGCAVRYEQCKIHHIHWWRHGGLTNLDNLIPLCPRHHHAVHDSSWQLSMSPDRTLTVNLPDGTTMTNGPPNRRAA